MNKKSFSILILFIHCSFLIIASPRSIISINESWCFLRNECPDAIEENFDDSTWEIINIPHTWNASDVMDETPGYYRNTAWYRRSIYMPKDKEDKQITIFFEGANQELELYINGEKAGSHVGGYTRFSFDITPFLNVGNKNLFAIKVTNRYNENIPPLTADFTFFGGIYRDVYLIYTEKQHISTTYYASPGVFLSTPVVNSEKADVEIKTLLTNAEKKSKKVRLEHTIIDPDKKSSLVISSNITLNKDYADIQTFTLNNPRLWSIDNPELYTVYSRVIDIQSNKLLDEVIQPLGIRWFEFSTEKGFLLNGDPVKLIGASRHQCYDALGNALPDEIHVKDVKLLKAMGGNFLRVAHYPQDPVIMEMCDKLGIVTSVEVPIINTITESDEFYRNSLEMLKEMVYQDYNRPSVVIWAYMNEVLLKLPYEKNTDAYANYLLAVKKLANQLEKQIRKDDPYRYTLIPFHGNFQLYHEAGLTKIPMIIGWNLYQGWYGGKFELFDDFLQNTQKELPDVPFIITEYGADVDPRLHSFDPERFDYTAEYANLYHEHYLKTIMELPYVAGATIWNLNDFHSETRNYAVPHINLKGITSTTRQPKDTYLHYKAFLSKEPVVLLGGSDWKIRGGIADEDYTCSQPVKIYSNLPEVELVVNSFSLGKKQVKENIALFDVPFSNGENVLEAVGTFEGKAIRDLLKIDFRMIPNNLKNSMLPFEEINIMLGSKRYFEDKTNDIIWLPEREYSPGSWGYVGGERYTKQTTFGRQPTSDFDILGTTNDPIFQTMRKNIEAFKLDVPNGQYTISFYWAELEVKKDTDMTYNIENKVISDETSERIFDIEVNGCTEIRDLNLLREYGACRAVEKKMIINVANDKGITVKFTPKKGIPILNAIRIYRNY